LIRGLAELLAKFRKPLFDKAGVKGGSCRSAFTEPSWERAMKAADLQQRLAELAPGETLLLSAAEVEQAFAYERTHEGWRASATALANLYQCSLMICGPDGSQVSFVGYSD
jgi:hypothetical protein